METGTKKSAGPLIGIIVIIVVLVIGAFYFWGGKVLTQPTTQEVAPVSKSDDAASLEADLNTTDTTSTDFSSLETAQ
jgi:hypothetical protein